MKRARSPLRRAPAAAPVGLLLVALALSHAGPARASGGPAIGGASRVIVVSAPTMRSTFATARSYERIGGRWHEVRGPMTARLGWAGLSWPARRREGDGTTPIGSYGFVYDFGSRPNPGVTGFAWRRVVPGSCWSSTPRDYNRWLTRHPCPSGDEDLWASAGVAYRYAAVMDFNYRHPIYPRGSAIFLHEQTGGPTAGCISLRERDLLAVLRWMRPGTRIVVGPAGWLRSLRLG